jgi:chemotaxis protein MotB
MALSRIKRNHRGIDYWPGFVDALSTLLLVVTFLMVLFMVAQYFVAQEAAGKDTVLARLQKQIAQMADLLALERSHKKDSADELSSLRASLAQAEADKKHLQSLLGAEGEKGASASGRIASLTKDLEDQRGLTAQALSQVELLNQQLAALRRQIAALEASLDASEKKDKESQTQIADLGQRLNVALARRVQELSQYRSNFFGELRKALGNRDDIQIVGDRFVFQAEIFFDSGSAELNPAGYSELDKLADGLKQLEATIPNDLKWVLRVDGHTDTRPIATPVFASNWELSTARAISVVKYLISKGISPSHLVAAGFGEYQPLATGNSEADLRRNRRIELKLTER